MLDADLFLHAYGKLYSNNGSMTQGVDGDEGMDGMSLERIHSLIAELRDGTFHWKPSRRVYIPKGNGQKRPIGIPSWKDKLVQEVIRLILEAYYEPQFSDLSHGFRPNRSCHTALEEVMKWKGTRWWIEGDIKGCFDNIDTPF
jgi:retron-type reverse transcriptase